MAPNIKEEPAEELAAAENLAAASEPSIEHQKSPFREMENSKSQVGEEKTTDCKYWLFFFYVGVIWRFLSKFLSISKL